MLSRLSHVRSLVMNLKTIRCPKRKADNRPFRLITSRIFTIFVCAYSPG